MSDDPRQEVEIKLGGKVYRCRPTFQKIVSIEGALGQPARTLGLKCFVYGIALANRGSSVEEISLTEMSVILYNMLKDEEGAPTSANDIGEILVDDGYGNLCQSVGDFLVRAQQGNKEHLKDIERKAKKEAAKSPPDKGPTVTKAD